MRRQSEPHEILGLKPDATANQIRSRYRALARRFHPDVNEGDRTAEWMFKQIHEAYEATQSAEARRANPQPAAAPPPGSEPRPPNPVENARRLTVLGGLRDYIQLSTMSSTGVFVAAALIHGSAEALVEHWSVVVLAASSYMLFQTLAAAVDGNIDAELLKTPGTREPRRFDRSTSPTWLMGIAVAAGTILGSALLAAGAAWPQIGLYLAVAHFFMTMAVLAQPRLVVAMLP